MPSTPFGEHLKREREMRGVSLQEVSAATRISTRFLEALENGQWDQLPGGAFNRGFIRSTAHFLGLNEDGMVAEYALETKDQNDSRSALAANAAMPRDWRPLGIAVGLFFLIVVAIAYGYHRYHLLRLRRQAVAVATATTPVAAAPPDSPLPPARGGAAPLAAATPPATPVLNGASKPAPAQLSPDAPAVLRLKIEDGKSTHVKILSDGKKVFEGRLRPKTPKSFSARDSFDVTSKDLGSLSLELNGQSVPVPSVPSAQPFKLTRKDLKSPADTAR